MFQQPSQGDKVIISELVGSLVLIWAHEHVEDIQTAFGAADAVRVDLHALDGPKGGEKFENTLIFQKALIGSLRSAIGGDPVLARIGQGTAKPGQSPPYVLLPFTDADAAVATGYIQRMPKPFQGAAGNGGPATTAPGATPAAAATATAPTAPKGAASPVVATPSAAAASPATGNTQVDISTLPPEVQELLRQTGAVTS